jgi:transcriptional regulator with XRE-family HTH domain
MKRRTHIDTEFAREIANKFAEAIDQQNLTIEDAAVDLGVRKAVLYRYLRGDAIPGSNVLQRACQEWGLVLDYRGLNVTPDYFKDDAPKLRRAPSLQLKFPFVREVVHSKHVQVEVGPKEIVIKLAK